MYNIIRISIQSCSREVNGSFVSKSRSESSAIMPRSLTEPLYSPNDFVPSEDHAEALPCTRFDPKAQVIYRFYIFIFLAMILNLVVSTFLAGGEVQSHVLEIVR